jgi:hypothetical protein
MNIFEAAPLPVQFNSQKEGLEEGQYEYGTYGKR